MTEKLDRTGEEWRQLLTLEQYHITRGNGTERPFSGEYGDFKHPARTGV